MVPPLAVIIPLSLLFIYKGADHTFKGATGLSTLLQLSRSLTGAVVVASVTALPEFSSSVLAVFTESSSLALGNILGSNVYNLPLLLGLAGLFGGYHISNNIAKHCIFLVSVNLITMFLSLTFNGLYPWMGVLLLLIYGIFIYHSMRTGGKCECVEEGCSWRKSFWHLVGGGIVLILGALFLVRATSSLIAAYNVNQFYAGIVMSLGSVVPEVAVSLYSAASGEHEISVGNIIGDNIITGTLILGVISMLQPIQVVRNDLFKTIPFTLAFTGLVYLMHKMHWKVTKKVSVLILISTIVVFFLQSLIV